MEMKREWGNREGKEGVQKGKYEEYGGKRSK